MKPVLYYSNYCEKSRTLIGLLTQQSKIHQFNTLCIDRRMKNPENNMWMVQTPDGRHIYLPPNINNCVPSVVLGPEEHCHAIIGASAIKQRFCPDAASSLDEVSRSEPQSASFASNGGLVDSGFCSISSLTDGIKINAVEQPPTVSKSLQMQAEFERLKEERQQSAPRQMHAFAPSYV